MSSDERCRGSEKDYALPGETWHDAGRARQAAEDQFGDGESMDERQGRNLAGVPAHSPARGDSVTALFLIMVLTDVNYSGLFLLSELTGVNKK